MMRRGCQVIALHMDNTPFTSPEARTRQKR